MDVHGKRRTINSFLSPKKVFPPWRSLQKNTYTYGMEEGLQFSSHNICLISVSCTPAFVKSMSLFPARVLIAETTCKVIQSRQ